MIIRTISQLPKVSIDDGIPSESLIEMSISKSGIEGQDYISKACKFEILRKKITDYVESSFVEKYKLQSNTNLTTIANNVNALMNGTTVQSNGNKTCNKIISLTSSGNNTYPSAANYNTCKNYVATMQSVYQAVNGSSVRVSNNSTIYDLQFKFNQQRDKNIGKMSYAVHNQAFVEGDNVVTPAAGELVVYGWLADTGTIDTAKCWVALQAKINGNWEVLQIQPWILGSRHQNLQYVGFNALVAKDLQLRIQTGFDIDYNSSAYQMTDNTLVANTNLHLQTNMGPSFIGALYC